MCYFDTKDPDMSVALFPHDSMDSKEHKHSLLFAAACLQQDSPDLKVHAQYIVYESKPIGYVVHNQNVLWHIWIDPAHRRKGIGSIIANAILSEGMTARVKTGDMVANNFVNSLGMGLFRVNPKNYLYRFK